MGDGRRQLPDRGGVRDVHSPRTATPRSMPISARHTTIPTSTSSYPTLTDDSWQLVYRTVKCAVYHPEILTADNYRLRGRAAVSHAVGPLRATSRDRVPRIFSGTLTPRALGERCVVAEPPIGPADPRARTRSLVHQTRGNRSGYIDRWSESLGHDRSHPIVGEPMSQLPPPRPPAARPRHLEGARPTPWRMAGAVAGRRGWVRCDRPRWRYTGGHARVASNLLVTLSVLVAVSVVLGVRGFGRGLDANGDGVVVRNTLRASPVPWR